MSREPEQLGEQRGKVGWFASVAASRSGQGRARCRRAAEPPGAYRRGREPGGACLSRERGWQRAADATSIPRLSAAAYAAIGALRTAPDDQVRGEPCRRKSERVTAELGACRAAVTQELGDESVRQGQHGAASMSPPDMKDTPSANDCELGWCDDCQRSVPAGLLILPHQARRSLRSPLGRPATVRWPNVRSLDSARPEHGRISDRCCVHSGTPD